MLTPGSQLAHQGIEHRREQQAEDRDTDHAPEHRDAHGLTHLGSGARREPGSHGDLLEVRAAIEILVVQRELATTARPGSRPHLVSVSFDPEHDTLMHPFDQHGRKHMEYIRQRGSYDDLPLDEIFASFLEIYPGWERE